LFLERYGGSLAARTASRGLRQIVFTRHASLKDTGVYLKTDFPRSSLARRSTSKRKTTGKRESKSLAGQEREGKKGERKEALRLT
jgi:hypothetical protein